MMNKDADGLGWLKEIRRQIAEECGKDPKLMGDYFRSFRRSVNDIEKQLPIRRYSRDSGKTH